MKLGSPEHKAQLCQELLKTNYENIWKDELNLIQLEKLKGERRKAIAAINLKIDNKEFKSKNDGEKAKFVAEQELQQIENEIVSVTEKATKTWPFQIQLITDYLAQD